MDSTTPASLPSADTPAAPPAAVLAKRPAAQMQTPFKATKKQKGEDKEKQESGKENGVGQAVCDKASQNEDDDDETEGEEGQAEEESQNEDDSDETDQEDGQAEESPSVKRMKDKVKEYAKDADLKAIAAVIVGVRGAMQQASKIDRKLDEYVNPRSGVLTQIQAGGNRTSDNSNDTYNRYMNFQQHLPALMHHLLAAADIAEHLNEI